MKILPLAALAAAAMLSALIALDVVWNANNPDQVGPWLDAETHPYLLPIIGILHAVLYTLLAAALIQSGRAIDGGRPLVRVLRWILIGCFALFAGLFSIVIVDPTFNTSGVYEILVTVIFAVSLLVPIVLGFALIRRRHFRIPAILLIAPLVVLPITLIIETFTVFAHPGYTETAVNFGLALLCVAASSLPATSTPALHNRASVPVSDGALDR
ncbi:hypothetical protein ACLQ2Q_22155 [Microbacterium sp. DT81.1]|uniref:hypothetical protein n=1 Tax=Microbacterium sp. DT81.1 TaxID=3393413 RepID=UPI003CF81AC0